MPETEKGTPLYCYAVHMTDGSIDTLLATHHKEYRSDGVVEAMRLELYEDDRHVGTFNDVDRWTCERARTEECS